MGGGGGGGGCDVAKPVAAMVVVQVMSAGVNIFYKLAVSDGMDMRVLIAYRYLFATAFLAPLAYFIERKRRTKLTWRVLVISFICGLTGGSLAQNLYISGMKLTSATFASATTNLIPGVTFVLALVFRYERLAIRSPSGQAKVAGTLLGVAGAMLLTLYKGADITPWHSTLNLVASASASAAQQQQQQHHLTVTDEFESTNRVVGSLLCISSCAFYSLWLILQAKLSKEYPFHYSTTALMCAMSALQSAAFALCTGRGRDVARWRLGLDVRLLSVAYSGVLASGVMLVVLSWCVTKRGPLFASVFNPLMLLVVAVLGSLLLGERLYLGSALGAVLIVAGLYAVLWGKAREAAGNDELMITTKVVSELPLPVVVASTTTDDDDQDCTRGGDTTVDVVVVQHQADHHQTSDHDHDYGSKQRQQPATTTR